MHMAVSSQFRRSSCSPLEVKDLHTLWAAVYSVGPFFCHIIIQRYLILARLTTSVLFFLERKTVEIALAHRTHVDVATDPCIQQSHKDRVLVDRRTSGLRATDGAVCDGPPGFRICTHLSSTGTLGRGRHLSASVHGRDLNFPAINNIWASLPVQMMSCRRNRCGFRRHPGS